VPSQRDTLLWHAVCTAPGDYELVLVTFFSRDNVEQFLDAIGAPVPMTVVDNGQGADGLETVTQGRAGVRYQHGPARGFATAANLGARGSHADYLVFVNPDSRPSRGLIDDLVGDLRADPGLGAVAALMTGPDGRSERGAGGWQPSPHRALTHAMGLHKLFPTAGLYARPEPDQPIEVDWVTGACMAVPRKVFEELGGFDQRYFVYSEDVDFGRRLREAGYRLRLRTDLKVPHQAGSSGGTPSVTMSRLEGSSFAAYSRRHLRPAAAATVIALESGGAAALGAARGSSPAG